MKSTIMLAIAFCIGALNIHAAPADGVHFSKVKLKMSCDNGKVFSSSVDQNGNFSFTGIDDDCDGFTLEFSGTDVSVKPTRIEMMKSSSSTARSSSSVRSPRDAASGQASGKRTYDKSSPVLYKITGDLDGDGIPEKFEVSASSSGSSIQGKIRCPEFSRSAGYDLKQNKK